MMVYVWGFNGLSFLPRLAPPFQVRTQGCMKPKNQSLFATQKQIWDIQEPRIQIPFSFKPCQLYRFKWCQVEVGHSHGRMGFGKSYYTDWGMGLNLRIWNMMSFLSLCLWICIYIYSWAQNRCTCAYIGYVYSYMHVYIYIYMYVWIYTYLYLYTYIPIYMYTYVFVYFFICIYVQIYLSVCAWIYLNSLITHVDTHTNPQTLLCVLQGFLTNNLARTVIQLLTHIFNVHSSVLKSFGDWKSRLDTGVKCLPWSVRYSGQMPLLIN